MLQHYIRIAIRYLGKQKILTFINVFGLSLGLACFSLFLLFAVNEFSYDRFHKNADHLFRVDQTWKGDNGQEGGMAGLCMPLGPALKKEFPDVENFVRFTGEQDKIVRAGDRLARWSISYADPQVFSVFSFPLLAGNGDHALEDPHSLVLTRSKARQLFGQWDVVGRTVEIKMDTVFEPFTVTAVMDDIPDNSSIRCDALGSYNRMLADPFRKEALNDWHMTNGDETFVQLRPDSRLMSEPDRLLQFRFRHYPDEAAIFRKDKKVPARFTLRPLRDLHTTTNIDAGPPGTTTDPKNIWILLSIAAGIVLIAAINFTTLAIARSAGRAKEVGVRKVMGGWRRQLIAQFLTESILLSVLSSALGFLLAYLLLPYFSQLAGRPLEFSFGRFPELTWMLTGLTLLVGLLAGSYPAIVLSGFNPVDVLKSKIRLGGSNLFTRSLVTFQFVLSIGLIIATVIILQQVSYLRSRDLGLIKENTIVVKAEDADAKKAYTLFRQALQSHKEIIGIAASELGLGEGEGQMGDGFDFNGQQGGVIEYPVDTAFINVMGMRLLAGRNFNAAITADTVSSVIVNESLLRVDMGLSPEAAIGRRLKGHDGYKTIIGVVKDFNFEPLNQQVRPQLFFMPAQLQPGRFFVRVRGGDPSQTLADIHATWKKIVPDIPFRYSFLDEDLDRFYKAEARWRDIIGCAGVISIFLACLGLFGLAALSAANRIKEIGIRKVLGASVPEIVRLLSGGFLRLVVLASLIASPLAWYAMNKWLQGYAYRIDIGWWIFAVTGILALAIAFMTIGLQAARAAKSNPVKSLHSE
jgi:putative ABC transport system permease protein